ncbi:hypothetical protein PF011_g584 [Phytophthora fragariae]|uniref:Uncharacterized protein n=1 Tax=Phytophthora fragariae TaxID=53985 RepID=A0A6A3MDR0_9STRA|nr:hypothetical protein PF011_g584 [Phytophthora fragariae]
MLMHRVLSLRHQTPVDKAQAATSLLSFQSGCRSARVCASGRSTNTRCAQFARKKWVSVEQHASIAKHAVRAIDVYTFVTAPVPKTTPAIG